jgi:hypothetical protein
MASIVFTTASGTTTLTAADGSGDQAVSIPRTSTLVGTDIANTFTANQTFTGTLDSGALTVTGNIDATGTVKADGRSYFTGASENFSVYLQYNAGTNGMYLGATSGGNFQVSTVGGASALLVNADRSVEVPGGNLTVTGQYIEEYNAVTSSSNATTCDLNDGNNFSHTLTENTTFTFSNPASSGKVSSFTLKIVQDASASGFTVTWPAAVDWAAATAPTLTATADAVDYFVFITHDGGTTWYGFTAGQAMG